MFDSGIVKRIRTLMVTAFVVGGLSFGVAQLGAGEGGDCEGYHGPCADQGECEELCIELFPLNGGEGICFLWNHCCMCAER